MTDPIEYLTKKSTEQSVVIKELAKQVQILNKSNDSIISMEKRMSQINENMTEAHKTIMIQTKRTIDQQRSHDQLKFLVESLKRELDEKKKEIKRQDSEVMRLTSSLQAINSRLTTKVKSHEENLIEFNRKFI